MTDDIYSCSYYCDRPECIKAQRDELVRKYVECIELCESGLPTCGPVNHWDVEGVPLCDKCWNEFLADADHG